MLAVECMFILQKVLEEYFMNYFNANTALYEGHLESNAHWSI